MSLALAAGLLALLAPPTDPPDEAGRAYAALLERAKADPARADFAALRRAFAETADYPAFAARGPDTGPVDQELKNGEIAAGMYALDRVIAGYWADPLAHDYAAEAGRRLHQRERASLHRAFRDGLAAAILDAGDGRSFATAWPVLSRREARAILESLDLDPRAEPAEVEHEGRHYDVYTFRDPTAGAEFRVYFDVDRPRRALGQAR